eukprot:Em0009g796a
MDDETLINKVKEHPCLYNTKLSDYKVLLKKENAWKAISTAVKASDFVKHRCTTGNMEPSSIPSDDEADNGVNCSSQRNDESGAVQELVPNPPPPAAISEGHNSQPVSPSVISSSPVSTASLQSLACAAVCPASDLQSPLIIFPSESSWSTFTQVDNTVKLMSGQKISSDVKVFSMTLHALDKR